MKTTFNTLKRIKQQCKKHKDCFNCIFNKKIVDVQADGVTYNQCVVKRIVYELAEDTPDTWNLDLVEHLLNDI